MTPIQVLPRDGEWTIADLDLLSRDDGLRYELVDGTLLVSSAPSKAHQRAVGNLHLVLRADVPGHLEVFLAPTDYVLSGAYGPDDVLTVDAPYGITVAVRDLHDRNAPAH